MAPRRHPLRNWVVSMFRRGDLASPAEGALIASVPKQTIARWIREADIDVKATRLQYLARNQAKAQRYAAGLPPRHKPSKALLRRLAAKAVRDFNRAQQKSVEAAGSGDPG